MDEEKLNNDLKNRIREVFDNYEDTGADAGWLLLRQKFPVKEKDRGLAWLWYAAAAVVLLFSTIWLIPGTDKTQPVAAQLPKREFNQQKRHNDLPSADATRQSANSIAKITLADSIGTTPSTAPIRRLPVPKSINLTSLNAPHAIKPNADAPNTKQDHIISAPGTDSATNLAVNSTINKLQNDTGKPIVRNMQPQSALPVVEHKKDIYDLLAQKSNNQDKPTKQTGNKPVISVYAGTYFNYAKGSDSRVNLGVGFTSDFHITGRLKLSTGLAVAQNTLNYSNGAEPNSPQHEAAFASLATAVAKASGSPITGNGSAQSLAVFATNLGGTKNYNASLVGLDIPVNLKYEFNPQKSDAYISAGVSSGTFINETYREVYSYSQVSKENATHNSFSGFDVAKTLNFSFGVGYPLGKSNRLIVEPFFKYPLDGLGEQQIRFGAGGVNLKLNFRSSFKK